MFKLFNLYPKRKYYRIEFLLMTKYKIEKKYFLKSSCRSCIAKKKTQNSTYNGAGGGHKAYEQVKPQINHQT